jgi:uncharacterized sporulation protein YeaH/YhbH (DUF444 family)
MPKRIQEDHKKFRDVVSGRTRKELKRLIKSGAIVRQRPRGGKVTISIPQIDIPHFVFGDTGEGVGRGPGKEGDVIGRDPQPGDKGSGAGDTPGEGIHITIDLDDVLKFMEEELKLPRMKPKPSQTFEEEKIKYNDISKVGLNSLRHTRRTMREALKRLIMTGKADQLQLVPGASVPMKVITPIKQDFRFRQFRKIKIPSSNAVIFFARDCSGSMDDYRCDIVSDMCWWLDCWIRKFYKRVDRCYFVHDTRAMEVNEEEFYTYRYGGGTQCSSAFETISEQLTNRYPPEKFNVYVFYFSDGDNWTGDNDRVIKIINEKLTPERVNLIGITQVCSWRYEDSVKQHIDEALKKGELNKEQVKTAYVGPDIRGGSADSSFSSGWGYDPQLTEEDRNTQIIEAIKKLLTTSESRMHENAIF